MPNPFAPKLPRAALVLADGTVFSGYSFGAPGFSTGEVVFNTAMTGYQEILSDPSYARQIVTLTCPQIGNTGANSQDMESQILQVAGLVIRALPLRVSSWRSDRTLPALLQAYGKLGLVGIDTRRLTRLLRERGAQNGCLVAAAEVGEPLDIDAAQAAARSFPGLAGMDLTGAVTVPKPYPWVEGSWSLESGYRPQPHQSGGARFRVVAYDFGLKHNIMRLLADQGCDVTIVPAATPAAEVLAMKPDGIFYSNGPGDPEPCRYAIDALQVFLAQKIPFFGICLGHQLLGLAVGGRTTKMKFGHHGANHPVKDLDTGRVCITSQNHGFAVDPDSLPAGVRTTHVSLFDGSLQGIALSDTPAFSFQGHPEGGPGPHDVVYLFERFARLMAEHRSH
ncbi:MAG: glutamine-hydrolyzing carbamoyl-phosphate synthase small subunit [Lautropia sp.]|nr:glutamine-hydrolyzing carbamoyl-phosphate synthase small subunit [Lautropia sp.]